MTRLVVAEMSENAERDFDVEASILGPGIDIQRFAYSGDTHALVAACRNADVILTDYVPLGESVIAELRRCRLISVSATGYNCVDIEAAKAQNISVCALDAYCTDEVADHTMLLMLALCRRLIEYDKLVQSQYSWQFDSLSGLRRLRGMTLGIIGFGTIGRAVAKRARSFGMSAIAYDPYADAGALGVRFRELPELLAESDVISLHCNLSEQNRHLIDANAFGQMQRRPILINCARGGLVAQNALVAALDAGQISAAGLDVLGDESPDLRRSGLTGRGNVILTPHVAFYSDESILENRRLSASNIRHFLDGEHASVRKYIHHATR